MPKVGGTQSNMDFRRRLDQFYTSPAVAADCFATLLNVLPVDPKQIWFIEPAAGDGAFFDLLPKDRRTGLDLMPHCAGVCAQDFLVWEPAQLSTPKRQRVVIGNPPFGARGKLAVAFVNQAAQVADTVAFIVPVCFRKFAIHKQLDSDLQLICRKTLPRKAFRLANGNPYAVNTEFQVWTRSPCNLENQRLFQPLPITHPHFEIRQYNNTQGALKVFDQPFDFAVPCQGWQDYRRRETEAANCERNKQWMLFSVTSATGQQAIVRERLLNIDYENLALRTATAVPGFRKADLVQEYQTQYGQ